MSEQQFAKRQVVVTKRDDYRQMLCSIAQENGFAAKSEANQPGRFSVEVECSANCINSLNAEVCKSLLPESASWEIDDAPNGGNSPFVDVWDSREDWGGPDLLPKLIPISRRGFGLFLPPNFGR